MSAGRIHTYIKDDGRSWSQTLDADVGEHFEHMAFSARHVHKSEKAIMEPPCVGVPAVVPSGGFTTKPRGEGLNGSLASSVGGGLGEVSEFWGSEQWLNAPENNTSRCCGSPTQGRAGGWLGVWGGPFRRRHLLCVLKVMLSHKGKPGLGPVDPHAPERGKHRGAWHFLSPRCTEFPY